ncbi:hypothetical protein BAC2_01229 [uncultured bacterium]|nr:hypothetical protein BAC2_01229 [uncultured bacterium]
MRDIIMFVFPTRGRLVDASEIIRDTPHVKVIHSAIVAKAESGEALIMEDDINLDEGAVAGGTLGSLMGAMGIANLGAFLLPGIGPIIAIGAGALVGGLVGNVTGRFAANLLDLGYKHEQIDVLAERLKAGHPALVLSVKDVHHAMPLLQRELTPYKAELIERLRADGGV